jgi:hypothetical protein
MNLFTAKHFGSDMIDAAIDSACHAHLHHHYGSQFWTLYSKFWTDPHYAHPSCAFSLPNTVIQHRFNCLAITQHATAPTGCIHFADFENYEQNYCRNSLRRQGSTINASCRRIHYNL